MAHSIIRAVVPKYKELEDLLREILPRVVHAPDCGVRGLKACTCYKARAKALLGG
jgi:hypothetical protein